MDTKAKVSVGEASATKPANQAAWLLAATGLLTLANNYLPGHEHLNTGALTVVGVTALVVSVATRLAPWQRLRPRATLILPLIAFALIAFANRFGGVSAYSYGVYFIVVFAWVGLNHPPGTSLRLAGLAALAYVLPMLDALATLRRRLQVATDAHNARPEKIDLSMSVGVARFDPARPRSLEELLQIADGEMCDSKLARRDSVSDRSLRRNIVPLRT